MTGPIRGDRIFGAVVLCAVAYGAAALQLRTGFVSDPVGPKTLPLLVAGVSVICGLTMMYAPDPEADWPRPRIWAALALSIAVLVAYAYALRPLGFLLPTAFAAGILSRQIGGQRVFAVAAGLGLSVGLFVLFRYVLGLSLAPWPRGVF